MSKSGAYDGWIGSVQTIVNTKYIFCFCHFWLQLKVVLHKAGDIEAQLAGEVAVAKCNEAKVNPLSARINELVHSNNVQDGLIQKSITSLINVRWISLNNLSPTHLSLSLFLDTYGWMDNASGYMNRSATHIQTNKQLPMYKQTNKQKTKTKGKPERNPGSGQW